MFDPLPRIYAWCENWTDYSRHSTVKHLLEANVGKHLDVSGTKDEDLAKELQRSVYTAKGECLIITINLLPLSTIYLNREGLAYHLRATSRVISENEINSVDKFSQDMCFSYFGKCFDDTIPSIRQNKLICRATVNSLN